MSEIDYKEKYLMMAKQYERDIEELIVAMEGAANMMRGMLFDPNISSAAKSALKIKAGEIDSLTEKYGEQVIYE